MCGARPFIRREEKKAVMNSSRRRMIFNLSAFALLSWSMALAGDKADAINKSKAGLAINGYDAVAYFTESKVVKGDAQFQHDWMGAKWLFVSAANRELFAKNPAKYAPQFGGYCAWAVSNNYVYDADPTIWKIVEGKLYLNYNRLARFQWERDIPGRIKLGEQHWPGLHK
jgi:YHS domain-containing protein